MPICQGNWITGPAPRQEERALTCRVPCCTNRPGSAAGVSESTIAQILGHSSLKTTTGYLDARADEQLQAFARLAST